MRGFAFSIVVFLLCCPPSASFRAVQEAAQVVLTPADGDAYLRALSTTNRFCPVRCAGEIVQPSSTADLAAWLRANKGTAFTVKGGGHSYSCQSVPKDGGAMIYTGRLTDARVFRRPGGTAFLRAGAGVTFDQVVPRLAKMGYSMPHGECLTVGLAGWALNLGTHPELKNFENEWGYNGEPSLTKATFVNYAGSIFTIDKDGLHLIERGKESWFVWHARALATKAKADALSLVPGSRAVMAVSTVMRLFKLWGASLAIATEFEFELLPKPEPGFFYVAYSVEDVLDDGGKGQRLNQAILDVVLNSGPDPDLDCGILYVSGYFKGTLEGGILLKCADWASPTGATVERVVPPGYRALERKTSSYLFWVRDSYGKGWVPLFHAETVHQFRAVGGPEKFRDHLRTLERGDASGSNPCDACTSEFGYMFKPFDEPYIIFDNFCTSGQSNQDACSAFARGMKEAFLGNRPIAFKQNLPMCGANPEWKSQMSEYAMGAYALGSTLKWTWDSDGVVDFWLGLGHEGNGDICEAAHVQPVGATCERHGITADDLVEVELAKARALCPAWDTYVDFDSLNDGCTERIYNTATALPVTDIPE